VISVEPIGYFFERFPDIPEFWNFQKKEKQKVSNCDILTNGKKQKVQNEILVTVFMCIVGLRCRYVHFIIEITFLGALHILHTKCPYTISFHPLCISSVSKRMR
jgi:hypothetical protein